MQSGTHVQAPVRQQGGEAGPRHSPTRTWVTDPPPFGVASERFIPEGRRGTPEYHVAYRDVTQPPRWTAKGWVGIDDYIKPRRGTAPSVYGTSSLVPPSAPPRHGTGLASLSPSCPNEVRLQELLNLQRRRVATEPGPGAYEPRDSKQHRRFRRQHDPQMDGPFFLDQLPNGTSTRSKEIAALMRSRGDSGMGPGDYEGPVGKDAVMRSAPTYKVGTSDRDGRAQHSKSLSISRSIQHGIDWHVPVVISASGVAEAPPMEADPDDGPATPGGSGSSGTGRPSTADYGGVPYGGGRSASPIGVGVAESYTGAPPAPPSQVSRTVRREQQRRPGDWDWNRLAQNYRTSWTTLHGGAYTHGDHTAPRAAPLAASTPGGSPAASQPSLAQGIYPIQEESSGALEQDPSGASMGQQAWQYASAPQQQYPNSHSASQPQQQQPYYVASFGVADAGSGGGSVGASASPGSLGKALVSEEDLRRRRVAAELAVKAQRANNRVTDWQSKFAG